MREHTRGLFGLFAIGLLLGIGASGCDRTHLSRAYGRSFHAAFHAQAVNPDAGRQVDSRRIHGLDSHEAAVVAKTYRKGLAGPQSGSEDQGRQLLLVSPRAAVRDTGNMPPPSVPPER